MAIVNATITSSARVDGAIQPDFKAQSGKQNLMVSLNKWVMEFVRGGYPGDGVLPSGKDFYWAFDTPLAPLNTPSIGVTEIGLFDDGARAFDENLVGFDSTGEPIKAVRNQTLVEYTCYMVDSDGFGGATAKVRELRDRLYFALKFAGTMNRREDAFLIPPIYLRDYTVPGSSPIIGVIRVDPTGNAINEKFLVDPANNQLKTYKLLVRFLYDEYKNPL